MITFINQIVNLINDLHDQIWGYSEQLGLPFTDKDLHFWIIGLLGVIFFIFTDFFFRWLATINISLISFFFTSAIISILVLVLEVEQKLTGRGGMELDDILAGLLGFLVLLAVYQSCRFLLGRLISLIRK